MFNFAVLLLLTTFHNLTDAKQHICALEMHL